MSSDVITRNSVKPTLPVVVKSPVPIPAAPYRGLEPFRFVDSSIFFARDRELRKLLRFITMYRAVLLYGDSGSGKSSLINAGLIPTILKEGFIADRIRVQPRKDEEFIVERMPRAANGSASFLPSNFSEPDFKSTSRIVVPAKNLKKIVEDLGSDNTQLEKKTPLLIFDQFEELVTLFEESPPNRDVAKALAIQEAILNCLVDLIGSHHLKVKLLFVFREDYLAKLTKFIVRCPDLVDHYQRLIPPPKDALNSIIRGPFEKFPGQFGNDIPPELAADLAQQIIQGTDSSGVNLSEVQIVCLKLWSSDDPKTLLSKRNIQGILEDFLSESLNTLTSDLRQPALALLRRMVTSSGTRNVISEDDLLQLVKKEGKFSTQRLSQALEALVSQTKLVRRERRLDVLTYQLVSEFLIPWIKQQQQLQQARLVRRRAIRVVALGLLVALIMAAASFYVWRFRTEQALRDATVRDLTAQLAASHAAQADVENKYQRLFDIINSGNADALTKELSEKAASSNLELQKAKKDYDQLQVQARALQTDRDGLKTENDSLKGQNHSLLTENQRLALRVENYQALSRDLESKKSEITALNGQVKSLSDEKDRLARENQALKAQQPQPGPGQVSETVVFQYEAIAEGKSVQLIGEEFHGLLTLKLGKVFTENKPVYIFETEGEKPVHTARFKPSRNVFSMPFTYRGKSYRLEGRIAGEFNTHLRSIKIIRL